MLVVMVPPLLLLWEGVNVVAGPAAVVCSGDTHAMGV